MAGSARWWASHQRQLRADHCGVNRHVAQATLRRRCWSDSSRHLVGFPRIAHVSTLGLIDGVLASYVIATALAACEAYRAGRANQHATGIWFVASIMAGAAAACKYPGLIFAVAPLAVIFVAFERLVE